MQHLILRLNLFIFSPLVLKPSVLSLISNIRKQQAPGLVSKNNVRFVSKNPWYALATGFRNSAFSLVLPNPLSLTHRMHSWFSLLWHQSTPVFL